jgi:hypothetical protein
MEREVTMGKHDIREAARKRLRQRFGRPDLTDKQLADLAITHVQENVSRNGEPLTDDEAAEVIAEDARQMRLEKRAGQPARRG